MMVEGRWPERNACIAVTISAALCPMSRPAGVSTAREAGWQPEQEEAPGGASAAVAGAHASHNNELIARASFHGVESLFCRSSPRKRASSLPQALDPRFLGGERKI